MEFMDVDAVTFWHTYIPNSEEAWVHANAYFCIITDEDYDEEDWPCWV